jgi:hypothetical protein
MKGVSQTFCTQGGDMLAYLYDEMPSADRDRFELHLSDCGTCIDDFAELSQSRYPVYEWKQTEFDVLPTPRVVIPYGEATASWFDRLRAAFAFNPAFALGGVGAMLLVGVVTSYVLFSGSGVDDIAKDIQPSPSPVRMSAGEPLPAPTSETATGSLAEPAVKPRVVNASMPNKSSSKSAKPKATVPSPKKNERLPVYSTAEDDEDDSLRLADIFAELDTSE